MSSTNKEKENKVFYTNKVIKLNKSGFIDNGPGSKDTLND